MNEEELDDSRAALDLFADHWKIGSPQRMRGRRALEREEKDEEKQDDENKHDEKGK